MPKAGDTFRFHILRAAMSRFMQAACVALLLAGTTSGTAATNAAEVRQGEAIYRFGRLDSGHSIDAVSGAGTRIEGSAAACINCHRRSGLGGREGRNVIPPITGRYLFRPRGGGESARVPYVESMRVDNREPYSDATLARAIREGVDSRGLPLRPLMPRFQIDDAGMNELIAYLKSLDQRRVPGVGDRVLHFATVVTPDADPVKRRAMLAVLQQYFSDRNVRQMTAGAPVRSTRGVEFMAHRQWQLHVWELTGDASTWQEQLRKRLRHEPVFALVSGLGGRTWAPIHAFCEEEAIPCLFPNVELPVDASRDFHPLYFSRGVLLEAGLIARAVAQAGMLEVRQVYRSGDVGEAAAEALEKMLASTSIRLLRTVLPEGAPVENIAGALPKGSSAALVLWLRAPDLAALGDPATAAARVYVSGLMGGLEYAPIPAGWREKIRIAYPFDLPDKRRARVDFAMGWLSIRKIPIEAVQVQADTWLACSLLSETINHLSDTFIRPYLIERIEDLLEHRLITGYYPRLSLGTGQKFASKGGYIVRFADAKGPKIVADTEWIVPAFEEVKSTRALP